MQLGLIGRRITSSEFTLVVGSAETEASEQLDHRGQRLTSVPNVLGSAEAEAAEPLGPYKPKDHKQRVQEDRGVG